MTSGVGGAQQIDVMPAETCAAPFLHPQAAAAVPDGTETSTNTPAGSDEKGAGIKRKADDDPPAAETKRPAV